MAERSTKVVCFDLGGVLVRICQSWPEACLKAALERRHDEWLVSDAWRAARRQLGDRYQSGAIDCATYYAGLAALSEGRFSAEEFERMHSAWTLDHYPGAHEAQPGVVTACLSNTNHAHWVRLVGADGRNEYPAVAALRLQLASHRLGCAKPDARIYALAYSLFADAVAADAVAADAAPPGAAPLRPSDVIFFDDLPANVQAARAAGWTAFEVDPSGDTVLQMRAQLAGAGVLR